MKVVTIVGARPQFVKLHPVSRGLRSRGIEEYVLHTGQHYDYEMSQSFFEELGLPTPDKNLGIGGKKHADQVAEMLVAIDEVLVAEKPDAVLVFGDTDSTLAGALAASMARIPVAHVEAGMRSFNRAMPEERNRLVADAVSDILYAASPTAQRHLERERVQGEIVFAGDTMLDVVLWAKDVAREKSGILTRLALEDGAFAVATVHRAENTDDLGRLDEILDGLAALDLPVVFPVHPRTRKAAEEAGWGARLSAGRITPIDAQPYLDMIRLVSASKVVLTDSGGLQKEAFYLGVPCVTLRDETEWDETVELGWNTLVGASSVRIQEAFALPAPVTDHEQGPYGFGLAGEAIAEHLGAWLPSELS